jgi:hypothetical protein
MANVHDALNRAARGLHTVSHRRLFEDCETLVCQDARGALAGLKEADEQVSRVHDYVWPDAASKPVSQQEASDAIWRIHELLRPLAGEPQEGER